MADTGTVSTTEITELSLINRGKVRDVYSLDESTLLIVATDRISAFDCVMPNQIPLKGRILTQISAFWFRRLGGVVQNHLLSTDFNDLPAAIRKYRELEGRSTLARRASVFPVECVVRGYLEGSGWKDYKETGAICGQVLRKGLKQCEKLDDPIFTPATKAASGHDENIDFERFESILGAGTASRLRSLSLELYRQASEFAESKGILIADTKFEFGVDGDGGIMLIDEVLTPDSSRFWEAAKYAPGQPQDSFDKQFLREYLESLNWDKQPPAPLLPEEIVNATQARYLEAYRRLTGSHMDIGGTV